MDEILPGTARPAASSKAAAAIGGASLLLAAFSLLVAASADAADATQIPQPRPERWDPAEWPTLTNDWFGHGPAMRDAGLSLRVEWSQQPQGMVHGDGSHAWEYGGKLEALARLDFSKIGLWDGFSMTALATYNYGHNVNNYGGTLIPVKGAAFFPGDTGSDRFDFQALYFSQDFGDLVTVNVGKMSLVEFARGAPLRGGGGVDTFWNPSLATPITGGLSPATIFGAMASIKTDPVSFAAFVYDARDATNRDVFDDAFEEGVAFMGAATYRTEIRGLAGYYGLKGIYSTKEGVDLRDIQEVLLPPEAQTINTKDGGWFVGASFQQYLYQNPDNPAKGWGVFGEFGFMDGNPTILDWMAYIGIGGSSLIPEREDDRFGIAYFRYGTSDDLKEGLGPLFNLDDEQGVEAFYNFAVTPWFRLTADIQFIDPGSGDFGDATFVGIGTNLTF